jgi:putative ABC transport system substrate-binding protein
LRASTEGELDQAFDEARQLQAATAVSADSFFLSRAKELATLAARHAVPTIYTLRDYPTVGGLISYGSNLAEGDRKIGVYVGRILKGAQPEDLPVVQSSKFELVINLPTARALGLEIPPSLLARADEVIE